MRALAGGKGPFYVHRSRGLRKVPKNGKFYDAPYKNTLVF